MLRELSRTEMRYSPDIANIGPLHTLRAGTCAGCPFSIPTGGLHRRDGFGEVGSFVTVPSYDIVKKEDNNFVWVEAAHDIESAKKRVDELSRQSDAEFVIFNEHTLQVVETLETLISF